MRPTFESVQRVRQTEDLEMWVIDGWEFNDDGTPLLHESGQHMRRRLHFPTDTLEWRAAEYGIDPADTATLLDVVIAEFFMEPGDYDGQPHLFDGMSDLDTARTAHLARCAKVKLRHRLTTRGKQHPLERVRAESPIHPEVVKVKAGHVDHARKHEATRLRRAAAPTDEQRRVARWKATTQNDQQEITHTRAPDGEGE